MELTLEQITAAVKGAIDATRTPPVSAPPVPPAPAPEPTPRQWSPPPEEPVTDENPNERRFFNIIKAAVQQPASSPDALTSIVRAARALAATKGHVEGALNLIRSVYGDTHTADELERTMQAQEPSAGGFLIPESWSDQIIEVLQPQSILGQVNTQNIPNPTGTLHFNREVEEPSASWGPPEAPAASGIKATKSKWGGLTLSEKALWAFMIFSNKLLRLARPSVDAWAVMRLRRVFSKYMDKASHFGKNTKWEPCGIFTEPVFSSCNVVQVGALPDENLPIKMLVAHMEADGPMDELTWTMGPTLYGLLMQLRTEDGYQIYRTLEQKMLLGYPVVVSSQIPVQATATKKDTYLTLCNWPSYAISPVRGLELAYTTEASVPDENGVMRSMFGNDETAIRMTWSGDMGPLQPKAFTIAKDVHTIA